MISSVMNTALSGMRAQEMRALAIADNAANATTPGYRRQETAMVAQAGGGVAATVRPVEPPRWPDLSTVDLANEILELTETQIAYTANVAVLETGADFWDMLATALERDERRE